MYSIVSTVTSVHLKSAKNVDLKHSHQKIK